MPYDGYGNFTRDYNWTADADAGITIQAPRMDGEFDNFAGGMNQVILRSGVTPFTGDVRIGGNRIIGLANGSAGTPSVVGSVDATTGMFYPAVGVLAFSAGGVERMRLDSSGGSIPRRLNLGSSDQARTTLDVRGFSTVKGAFENVLTSTADIAGTTTLWYDDAAVFLFDTVPTGNWVFNITGRRADVDAGITAATLNDLMAVGQVCSLAVEVAQTTGLTSATAVQVDGAAPASLRWANQIPAGGVPNSIYVYHIRIIKTANATFKVRVTVHPEVTEV